MTFALLLLSFVCFALAAMSVSLGRINLVALGLALWVVSILVGFPFPGFSE